MEGSVCSAKLSQNRRLASVRCRTALQQSPTAGRRPRQKARSSSTAADLCSKLRIARGSPPCSRSLQSGCRTADMSANRSLQRPARANSVAETASAAAQLGGSPCMQRQLAGSHCRLVCERWRGGAAELCKKLPPRLRILRQSCEFFGEAFACNGSWPLQQTGLPAMQDDTSHNSVEFLQLFSARANYLGKPNPIATLRRTSSK